MFDVAVIAQWTFHQSTIHSEDSWHIVLDKDLACLMVNLTLVMRLVVCITPENELQLEHVIVRMENEASHSSELLPLKCQHLFSLI